MRIDPFSRPGRFLLWFGLVGGPAAWTVEHVLGYGATEAACGAGGSGFGIGLTTWEAVLTSAAAGTVLAALLAATVMFVSTGGVDHEAAPPLGRMRFVAAAGLFVATLFLFLTLMAGIGAVALAGCHQS